MISIKDKNGKERNTSISLLIILVGLVLVVLPIFGIFEKIWLGLFIQVIGAFNIISGFLLK